VNKKDQLKVKRKVTWR